MGYPLGIISYNAENIGNFERTDSFSIEVWFYQTSLKSSTLVGHMMDAPTRRGWEINVWSGRNIGMLLCHDESTGNFLHVRTGAFQFAPNAWNHVVFTYNGGSLPSSIKCYLNGALKTLTQVGTYAISGTMQSNAKLWIGHTYTYPFFPGRLDEVVIYDRVLSAVEVGQRYNGGAGTETLFGLAYLQYHLNELSGSSVSDSSGNFRHARIINSPTWMAGKLNNCILLNGSSQYIEA